MSEPFDLERYAASFLAPAGTQRTRAMNDWFREQTGLYSPFSAEAKAATSETLSASVQRWLSWIDAADTQAAAAIRELRGLLGEAFPSLELCAIAEMKAGHEMEWKDRLLERITAALATTTATKQGEADADQR
jgi:hypothetical protein